MSNSSLHLKHKRVLLLWTRFLSSSLGPHDNRVLSSVSVLGCSPVDMFPVHSGWLQLGRKYIECSNIDTRWTYESVVFDARAVVQGQMFIVNIIM